MLPKLLRMAAFLALLGLGLGAGSALAAGSKARGALEDVTNNAKQWKPDAVLTSVSTNAVNPDGTAAVWFYHFYSRKADQHLNITSKGRALDPLEVGTGPTAAVAADFIDSDHAMQAAVARGLKGESPQMGLTSKGWIVSGGSNAGDVAVTLNARTGAMIAKNVVPKY